MRLLPSLLSATPAEVAAFRSQLAGSVYGAA
jgi:hypothetical protein